MVKFNFILYFNSIAVPTNLVPLKVRPHSVQDERVGITAKCSSKTITLYFHRSDVFVGVPVVGLHAS